jgi:hypothetical protein
MSTKYEILPPSRAGALARRDNNSVVAAPPCVNPGNLIESTLTRWEANRHARTIGAVAARTRAEADLFEAQTQVLAAVRFDTFFGDGWAKGGLAICH